MDEYRIQEVVDAWLEELAAKPEEGIAVDMMAALTKEERVEAFSRLEPALAAYRGGGAERAGRRRGRGGGMTPLTPYPFIVGDTCGDVMVCEICGQTLPFETVYLAVRHSGVEGSPLCVPCVEGVARRLRAFYDEDVLSRIEEAERGT